MNTGRADIDEKGARKVMFSSLYDDRVVCCYLLSVQIYVVEVSMSY